MKVSIICSSKNHPVYNWLVSWKKLYRHLHDIEIVENAKEVSGGDILFLISCHEIISAETRALYKSALVIHASDLPLGRGWSPHIWQVLEGKNNIVVSLLEVEDQVDSGDLWCKKEFALEGHELANEINAKLFDVELELMNFAIENFKHIIPEKQDNSKATYYKKRTIDNSRLDVNKSIAEQFELLRVSDPDRYPAFIEYRGYRYIFRISKVGPVDD